MLKQGQNALVGLFLFLSLILLGIGCSDHGSDSTETNTFLGDSDWTIILNPQIIGDKGDTVPITHVKSSIRYNPLTKKTSIHGVAGYGTFYTADKLTVKLLFTKKTITLIDMYVGGLVTNFSFNGSATTNTYQRDVHRDLDKLSDDPEINYLETKQYGDKIHWVALTGQRKILYYHGGLIPAVDMHAIDAKYGGEVQMIDVKFPHSGLSNDLKLLVFYADGAVSYYKGSKFIQVAHPSETTGFFSKSVNWGSNTEIPKMVVGHTNGVIRYYPGSGRDWNDLTGPGGENPIVKVNWTGDFDSTEVVATKSRGYEVIYKKGLQAVDDWTSVGIWPNDDTENPIVRLEVGFGENNHSDRIRPYPQIVCLFKDGTIEYFNGNSNLTWLHTQDKITETYWTWEGYHLDYYAAGLLVPHFPPDNTDAYPPILAFSSYIIKEDPYHTAPTKFHTIGSLDYYEQGPDTHVNLGSIEGEGIYELPTDVNARWESNGKLRDVVVSTRSAGDLRYLHLE